MENMRAKRHRKVKGGRAATEAAAAASEEVQKLSTQCEGAAEANSSNYVLISVRGEVGEDNNGKDWWNADCGRGSKRFIAD